MSEQRHNYEYDVDTASSTAPANVVRLVGQGKRVLELGCGPGSITKILAKYSNCSVTGLELDAEAIKRVTPYCERVFRADLNSQHWPDLLSECDTFDVVVAADVLEHLYDPWTVLKQVPQFLKKDGYIVISLPHVGHAAIMSCLIEGDFEYRDWGLLDRTHIRFFGLRNIENLFASSGLAIIDVRYVCKSPEETEFAEKWARIPSSMQSVLRQIPHSNIYQVVIKAIPVERASTAVSLTPSLIPGANSRNFSITSTIKRSLANNLTPNSKQLIRKLASAIGIRL